MKGSPDDKTIHEIYMIMGVVVYIRNKWIRGRSSYIFGFAFNELLFIR